MYRAIRWLPIYRYMYGEFVVARNLNSSGSILTAGKSSSAL